MSGMQGQQPYYRSQQQNAGAGGRGQQRPHRQHNDFYGARAGAGAGAAAAAAAGGAGAIGVAQPLTYAEPQGNQLQGTMNRGGRNSDIYGAPATAYTEPYPQEPVSPVEPTYADDNDSRYRQSQYPQPQSQRSTYVGGQGSNYRQPPSQYPPMPQQTSQYPMPQQPMYGNPNNVYRKSSATQSQYSRKSNYAGERSVGHGEAPAFTEPLPQQQYRQSSAAQSHYSRKSNYAAERSVGYGEAPAYTEPLPQQHDYDADSHNDYHGSADGYTDSDTKKSDFEEEIIESM
jgi:hypothetical protein